jgi:hypothetical protein
LIGVVQFGQQLTDADAVALRDIDGLEGADQPHRELDWLVIRLDVSRCGGFAGGVG